MLYISSKEDSLISHDFEDLSDLLKNKQKFC